jgi:adenylate cyclase
VAEERRRLAAIMFTDMVGFSSRAQSDEATALALLDRHNRLLRPIFAKFHGREVKTVGDAFVVEFESALDATRCALDIQRMLHYYNLRITDPWKIRIRIGIHVGDVVESNGDVLGDSVNIAARIVTLAGPEGVCLSQQVYDQVATKANTRFEKLPPVSLKNVRVTGSIYSVVPVWDEAPARGLEKAPSRNRLIAVLPLASISPDPQDGYFADGLTDELISELSQVRGLSVIARTSVTPYKTAPKTIAEVAHELQVDTVVEGSVRKSGSQVRISLTLVDAETQRRLWTHRYDREVDDVFAVQEDIAKRTSKALRLEMDRTSRGEERPVAVPNPRFGTVTTGEAYDHYLRGLVAASGHRDDGQRRDEAARHFELATRLDPNLAEAYAAWANYYVTIAGDEVPMREVIPRARELAQRALDISPDLSDAHSALGNIALQFDHDWERAETEFSDAIALNASNVVAYRFYGMLLRTLGRYEEAKQVIRRSIVLDPGGHDQVSLAATEILSGNVDAGLRLVEEVVEHFHRDSAGHRAYLGLLYLRAGRRSEALRMAEVPADGATESERFDHALLNALLGRPEAARLVLAEVERGEAKEYTSGAHLAMLYSALGERGRALDLLEEDYRDGDAILWLYHREVFFDPLRDEPRFVELLRKYRLPVGPSPSDGEPTPAPRRGSRSRRDKTLPAPPHTSREHGASPSAKSDDGRAFRPLASRVRPEGR